MRIVLASLCLRFYKSDGWNKAKVRKLLVNPKMRITYRKTINKVKSLGDSNYYAVYAITPNRTDYKIFKRSEIIKHKIDNKLKALNPYWYINEEK